MSLSGISLVSVAERGKCSASTTPTRSIAATNAVARPALLHLDEQRRHGVAPDVSSVYLQ